MIEIMIYGKEKKVNEVNNLLQYNEEKEKRRFQKWKIKEKRI